LGRHKQIREAHIDRPLKNAVAGPLARSSATGKTRELIFMTAFLKRGFIAIAIMLGGLIVSVSANAEEGYTTAPVTPMRIGDETRVSGTVIPYKEVTLAAQVPGEIKFIAGREGDTFEEGAVLVAVDDENIRAKRRAAVATLMAAQSAMQNARIQYNRELLSPKTGKQSGFGFPMMMDDMFRGFQGQTAGPNRPWVDRWANIQGQAQGIEGARSRMLAARAQIDELDAKLRDAQLKAPFKGKILAKLVENGDTVQPGQPLIKFGFTNYLRIQAEVPVRLLSSLRTGLVVNAHIDVHGGQSVPARVAQIYPVADPTRHTVTVKFDLPVTIPAADGTQVPLPGGPGMYAEVSLPDLQQQARWLSTVPASAIISRRSLKAVMVLENGKPSLRMVRVGEPVSGGRVAILSGLRGDEKVITGPPEKLSSMQSGGR
jgi:RND family efflux transporter MFP subunit